MKKYYIFILFVFFVAHRSYAGVECDIFIYTFFEMTSPPGVSVDVTPGNIDGYSQQKVLSNIRLDDIESGSVNKILEYLDRCSLERKPVYLERSGWRFPQEMKDAFSERIDELQKNLLFVRKMMVTEDYFEEFAQSCIGLLKMNNIGYVNAKSFLSSNLFGKPIGLYGDKDFDFVYTKIDSCAQVVTENYPDGSASDEFHNRYNSVLLNIQKLKVLRDRSVKYLERKSEEEKAAIMERHAIDNPPFFASLLYFGKSLSEAVAGVLILIGVAGFVKRDARFKTGNKDNLPDMPWALPFVVYSILFGLASAILGFIAKQLHYGM